MSRQQRTKEPLIDIFTIVKYFILWILFAIVAYGVKTVVMMALAASPTKQVGNGVLTLYEVHNTGAAFNLFSNGMIYRNESKICWEYIKQGKSVIIHGQAGAGKSGCTANIINFCER